MLQIFSPSFLFVFSLHLRYLMPCRRRGVRNGGCGDGGLTTLPFSASRLKSQSESLSLYPGDRGHCRVFWSPSPNGSPAVPELSTRKPVFAPGDFCGWSSSLALSSLSYSGTHALHTPPHTIQSLLPILTSGWLFCLRAFLARITVSI